MKKPLLYSVIFHLLIVLMVFFKLPYKDKVIKVNPISVDIVSEIPKIAEPVREVAPVKEVKKVEKPIVKKHKPAPRKPKPKKVVKKKAVKKVVKKKIPVKKTPKISKEELEKRKLEAERKKKEDEFKSVLADLQSLDDEPTQDFKSKSSAPVIPLSYSDLSEIKYQIEKCWQIPPSVATTSGEVVLRIRLNKDGSLVDVKVVDAAKYNSNQGMKLLAESALRAVEKCSPLRNLPAEKYSSWQDMELGFDPQNLSY